MIAFESLDLLSKTIYLFPTHWTHIAKPYICFQIIRFTSQNHMFVSIVMQIVRFIKQSNLIFIQMVCRTSQNNTCSYKSFDLLSKTKHLFPNHKIYQAKLYISYKSLNLLSNTIHFHTNHLIYWAKPYICVQIIGFTKQNYTCSYKSLDLLCKTIHLFPNHWIH